VLQALRDRRLIPMQQVAGCEGCEWASFCNGSCPGLAYQLTGDFNRANPEDCYRRFLLEKTQ
jgi:radical SAM protein with 4Fe4S-binding SPASM domain